MSTGARALGRDTAGKALGLGEARETQLDVHSADNSLDTSPRALSLSSPGQQRLLIPSWCGLCCWVSAQGARQEGDAGALGQGGAGDGHLLWAHCAGRREFYH